MNEHKRDKNITFNPKYHKYTVNGDNKYISVTQFIKKLFKEFNMEEVIKNILNSKKYMDPDYKYCNLTKEEILSLWEESRVLGTELHSNIEKYFLNKSVSNKSKEFNFFLNFINDYKNLECYRTEWIVYHENIKIAGSIDCVFKKGDEYYIYDWKRIEDLKFESDYNNSINPKISFIPDTNYWHYAIQLNMYKKILMEKYDLDIKEMKLVILHPTNNNYKIYDVPDLLEYINLLFL